MTIATAVLLTALYAATDPGQAGIQSQAQTQTADPAPTVTAQAQQAASGIIMAAEIEGRLAIYRSDHQLVVKLDKPAGRPLQIALPPGGYEARLGERGIRRVRFQIGEGDQYPIELASFVEPEASPLAAAGQASALPAPPHATHALDPRHHMEVRFGGWADGWYDSEEDWHTSGTAQGAFGFEYLTFVQPDLGIGIGVTGLARAAGDWESRDDEGEARVTSSIPVVLRWYPIRRATRVRSVEPYLTAGIGPVFGVDATQTNAFEAGASHHRDHATTRVAMTVGGRVGGGVEFRLGSVFTLGVGGAWNWDAGFRDNFWTGTHPSGGEFTMAFGWMFGR
jgi:hypothetical protein